VARLLEPIDVSGYAPEQAVRLRDAARARIDAELPSLRAATGTS
jgi:hypothetical protein